jgi:hypothetical protein
MVVASRSPDWLIMTACIGRKPKFYARLLYFCDALPELKTRFARHPGHIRLMQYIPPPLSFHSQICVLASFGCPVRHSAALGATLDDKCCCFLAT